MKLKGISEEIIMFYFSKFLFLKAQSAVSVPHCLLVMQYWRKSYRVCPSSHLLFLFVSVAHLWQDHNKFMQPRETLLSETLNAPPPGFQVVVVLRWPCDLVSLSAPPDLIHCTNELNVSIPHLADTLLERSSSSSWIVVFKALIATHHLMMYGNEVSRGAPSHWGSEGAPSLSRKFTHATRTQYTQIHWRTTKDRWGHLLICDSQRWHLLHCSDTTSL